jgi:EmrB/QacA subfamily drug resistance transporter
MTRYRARLITDANRKWWTLGAMCFALFMIMLDNTVVNVALPSIQRDLDASIGELEWVVNGYTLAFAVFLATGGRLGDIYGRRLMFIAGVILFAGSSATAGLAPATEALIASRFVQGLGAALMMPATLSIVTNAFSASERGKAIGTWAGVSALALSIGPLVGGFLTEHVSWRAIFYINLPVAAAAVLASLFAVRESRDLTVQRIVDYLGVATLTAALAAIVLALIEANSWGWSSPAVVGLLAGGALMLGAFVLVERAVRAPMVEFRLFASRNFLGANAVAFIVSFAMLGAFFFMAIYMQDVLGYTPLEAGARFLPTTGLIVLVAPLAGRLTDRIGPRWLIAAGLSILAVALYLFAQIGPATKFGDILPAFMLMGVGIAMTMSPMSTAAMNAVSEQKAGIASGILTMMRMVGGSVGVAATGAIFQARLGGIDPSALAQATSGARSQFVDALASAMWLASAVVVVGAVVAALTLRGVGAGRPRPAEEPRHAAAATPAAELAAGDSGAR